MSDQANTPTLTPSSAYSPLTYDPEMFREFVQGMDLSVEHQNALLDSVWLVIIGVIDLGLNSRQHPDRHDGLKPLAIDSSSMLALLSTSDISNAEDATARKPDARRTDS